MRIPRSIPWWMAAVLASGGALAPARAQDAPELEWKNRKHSLEELGEAPAAAANFWAGWCRTNGYRMALSKDQRLLLLLPADRATRRPMELVEKTTARIDDLIPKVESLEKETSAVPPGFSPEELLGEKWREREGAETASPPAWRWGDEDHPLDTDTVVLAVFQKPEHYALALEELGGSFPYLLDWIPRGKESAGCVMERPLFGAVVENLPGVEEWNADNELVHRVAQLLMLRRYGQQPVWVALGLAWNVEMDVLGSIYCFPWRSGFVAVTEHAGWESELKKMFKDRRDRPLRLFELAVCYRDEFDAECAALSWGAIGYLIQHCPEGLPRFLEELRVLRNRLGRSYQTFASWILDPDFEVPRHEQEEALKRCAGDDVLVQISESFREGRRFRRRAR